MDNSPVGLLTDQFAKLTDPRTGHAKRHKLIDVIVIAICAVICGADSWVDVEMFGKAKKDWFSRLLELPNGIPSHDTFGRVFARLDPVQFEECFEEWVHAVNDVTGGQVVAIDGKTLRRSHDGVAGKSAIHMVSAWASVNRLILGQTKVDERSNEITAIPELLSTLDVSGCTVTIDAMGCQKGIATTIIDQGADYVLALKENQPQLHQDVTETFEQARQTGFDSLDHDFHETVNKGHGRIETRRCWSVSDPDHLSYINDRNEWTKLTSVVMIESERIEDGKTSIQARYYISSLPNDARSAARKRQNALGDRELCPLGVGRSFRRRRQQGEAGQCSTELIRAASHGAETCSSVRPHHKGVWPPSASAQDGTKITYSWYWLSEMRLPWGETQGNRISLSQPRESLPVHPSGLRPSTE